MSRHIDFSRLERDLGIHLGPDVRDYIPEGVGQDIRLAMDAQPGLVTTSNSGIPAFLTNYVDPKFIQVLTTPNKAAKILGGEVQKGTWTTRTITFPMVESTGQTSSYGDWNNNGVTNANVQFPERQSYHYQTVTMWGEKQLEEADLAKIDWATRLNIASAMILDKFQNQTYFYGVANLQNYGLLNDPKLPPAITPVTKQAGGTTWAVATANEVYSDFQKLFAQLVTQSQGLIDSDSKLVLATTPTVGMALTNTNSFGITVRKLISESFPNVRFETAVQYSTQGGNLVQLIAEEVDGQETAYCAFTEKMRAHRVVPDMSSFKQKKSQGTWGTVIFLPFAIATMLGV